MTQVTGQPNSQYWKHRAEEAREKAVKMRDTGAKAAMLEISEKYEAMAERAALREASSN